MVKGMFPRGGRIALLNSGDSGSLALQPGSPSRHCTTRPVGQVVCRRHSLFPAKEHLPWFRREQRSPRFHSHLLGTHASIRAGQIIHGGEVMLRANVAAVNLVAVMFTNAILQTAFAAVKSRNPGQWRNLHMLAQWRKIRM